jgi:hypothetical protein
MYWNFVATDDVMTNQSPVHAEPLSELVEVKLRPTVSRPVRLSVRHPSGTHDQFFFLLDIFFRQLGVSFAELPLTRRRVCNLLLLLVLASAVPRDSIPNYIVPILETPPTWRARSLHLYLPGTEWPSYTPGHWVSFPSPVRTRMACWDTVLCMQPLSITNIVDCVVISILDFEPERHSPSQYHPQLCEVYGELTWTRGMCVTAIRTPGSHHRRSKSHDWCSWKVAIQYWCVKNGVKTKGKLSVSLIGTLTPCSKIGMRS